LRKGFRDLGNPNFKYHLNGKISTSETRWPFSKILRIKTFHNGNKALHHYSLCEAGNHAPYHSHVTVIPVIISYLRLNIDYWIWFQSLSPNQSILKLDIKQKKRYSFISKIISYFRLDIDYWIWFRSLSPRQLTAQLDMK